MSTLQILPYGIEEQQETQRSNGSRGKRISLLSKCLLGGLVIVKEQRIQKSLLLFAFTKAASATPRSFGVQYHGTRARAAFLFLW